MERVGNWIMHVAYLPKISSLFFNQVPPWLLYMSTFQRCGTLNSEIFFSSLMILFVERFMPRASYFAILCECPSLRFCKFHLNSMFTCSIILHDENNKDSLILGTNKDHVRFLS